MDAYNASPSGAYPLYDGHGNMTATLTKQPTNSFSPSARRYTDPWGVTRVGASTGKPDQRYCANLGHRQDDESGLTYMRARYYEATTGRFISEDPARDGGNWMSYCMNDPVNFADESGTYRYERNWMGQMGSLCFGIALALTWLAFTFALVKERAAATSCIVSAASFAAVAFLGAHVDDEWKAASSIARLITTYPVLLGISNVLASGLEEGARRGGVATIALVSAVVYSVTVLGALILCYEGYE
ncbi:MAG: RHS repeat-associated core domain-containing protein [Nitrospirae bacterium]|nr:RHS repeat-associated core domain-containing protein [Fimbriimonadaceae bacterium]